MSKSYERIDLSGALAPDKFRPPSGYSAGDGHHHGQKSFTSTREALHRGKKIKVRTTYKIEIDGEPLSLHTEVMEDGTVHCHGLPNYSFGSALDMVKAIIDAAYLVPHTEDELGGGHGDHDGGHGDHGGHH